MATHRRQLPCASNLRSWGFKRWRSILCTYLARNNKIRWCYRKAGWKRKTITPKLQFIFPWPPLLTTSSGDKIRHSRCVVTAQKIIQCPQWPDYTQNPRSELITRNKPSCLYEKDTKHFNYAFIVHFFKLWRLQAVPVRSKFLSRRLLKNQRQHAYVILSPVPASCTALIVLLQ